MSIAKDARDKLGISQLAMASYLKMTVSHLSMAENGNRDLPSGVTTKLVNILMALQNDPPTPEKVCDETREKAAAAKAVKKIQRHQIRYELKIYKLKQKLEALQKKQNQSVAFVHWLKLENEKENLPEHDKKWLSVVDATAHNNLSEFSEHALLLLRIQLSGFEQQVEESKKKIEELEEKWSS